MLLCQHWRSPRAPAISHRAWASLGAGGAPLPGPWASREGRCRNPEVTGRGRRPILMGLPSRGPQLGPHGQKRCVNCGPRVFSGCRQRCPEIQGIRGFTPTQDLKRHHGWSLEALQGSKNTPHDTGLGNKCCVTRVVLYSSNPQQV